MYNTFMSFITIYKSKLLGLYSDIFFPKELPASSAASVR